MIFSKVLIAFLFLLFASANVGRKESPKNEDKNFIASKNTEPLNFEEDILPIFKARCNPCHFPGGKMYGRLPFDQDSTILHNSVRILTRINHEGEAEKIRQFVKENSAQKNS